MYYKIQNYIDDHGHQVRQLKEVLGDLDTKNPDCKYLGMIQLGTPQGRFPIEFSFPENFTLEQCFEKFEEEGKKFVEEFEKKAREASLIVPASGNIPSPNQQFNPGFKFVKK